MGSASQQRQCLGNVLLGNVDVTYILKILMRLFKLEIS